MDILEIVRGWLEGQGIRFLVDASNLKEGIGGLYPQGRREVQRREDVLGGVYVTARYSFLLKLPAIPGGAMAEKLLLLQHTDPPDLGADANFTVLDGKLTKQAGNGIAWYELRLIAEREEENA